MTHDKTERMGFWIEMTETLERADVFVEAGAWQEAAELLAGVSRAFSASGEAEPGRRLRPQHSSDLRCDERDRVTALLARTREVLLKCIGLRDRALEELECLRRQERFASGFRDSPDAAWLSERV